MNPFPSLMSSKTLCPEPHGQQSAVSSAKQWCHVHTYYIRDMPICCGSVSSFILMSKLLQVVSFYKLSKCCNNSLNDKLLVVEDKHQIKWLYLIF